VVTKYRPLLGADARDTLNGEVAALVREGIEGIPRDALKLRRAQIQKLAQASYNRGDARLGDAYGEIKDLFSWEFMARLPTQQAAQLATLDKKYSQFVPILRAASTKGAVANEGTLTPGALLGALKADDPSLRDKAFALGNRPGQQEAQEAQQVFRRMIPSVGPAPRRRSVWLRPLVGAW